MFLRTPPKGPAPRRGLSSFRDRAGEKLGCTVHVNYELGMKLVGQESVSSRRPAESFEAMEALHVSRKRRVHTTVV